MFVICVDSTADMGPEMRKKYDIEYFKMGFSGQDGERSADLDWSDSEYKAFYDSMRQGKRYKTIQVQSSTFEEQMKGYLDEGKDILYIACSSALSGSVNTAKVIAGELMSAYPGRKIFCVDSLISSLAQASIAMKASEMRKEGKDVEETYNAIEAEKMNVNYCGAIETLTYLKDAGRVSASKSFFGNLFGVKPILVSNAKGENEAVKKAKGRDASITMLADIVAARIKNPDKQTVYITHSDDKAAADKLAELIEDKLPGTKIEMGYIGPIVGISVGPGTVIASFTGVDKATPVE